MLKSIFKRDSPLAGYKNESSTALISSCLYHASNKYNANEISVDIVRVLREKKA